MSVFIRECLPSVLRKDINRERRKPFGTLLSQHYFMTKFYLLGIITCESFV